MDNIRLHSHACRPDRYQAQNVPAILMLLFVPFGLVVAKARRTRTEINFTDRTIRRNMEDWNLYDEQGLFH